MDLKRFENNINQKFKNFEPEVNDSLIWEKLEKDLPAKKNRRPFWLLALLLIPAIYLATTHYTDTSDSAQKFESLSNTIPHTADGEKELLTTQASEKTSQSIVSNNSKKLKTQQVINSNLIEKNNTQKSIITQEQLAPSSNNEVDNKSLIVPTFAQASKHAKQQSSNQNLHTSKANLVIAENAIEESGNSNEIVQDEKLVDNDASIENLMDENSKQNQSLTDGEALVNPTGEFDLNKKQQAQIAKEEEPRLVKSVPVEANSKDQEAQGNAVATAEETVYINKSKLSLTAGILLTNRIYDTSDDPRINQVIAEKEAVEKQLETWQIDFQYKYRIADKIAVGIGLRHWKLSERSRYTVRNEYQDMVQVVTGITHHVDGTTTNSYSNVPVSIEESIEHTRYQTHTSWSVPIKLYYTLSNAPKFRTELGLGYEHSFAGKHEGYELGSGQTEYLISQDVDERYAKHGGNFFLANINTEYKTNSSIAITAGLEGKYGLNGFNTASALYGKKFHFLGVYAGLSYILKN